MRGSPETGYINKLDKPSDTEIERRSEAGEDIVVLFFNSEIAGLNARLSTEQEDSGVVDIGSGPTVDTVISRDGRPVLAAQITTAQDRKTIDRKMSDLAARPFVRVEGMNPKDRKIPKALVVLRRENVPKDLDNFDFQQHPELAIQILDGFINSLQFDLAQTKNPPEQQAILELITSFEKEKKKYIH